ncbi:uncharacterized protein LOC128266036 [Drosophila gunungcola]|uniref:uncharacterized protein LOC128266036 n=1 Tax=Drosophila gunungcola TaxID=103775 RepID=UPI0022E40100|nr:uncharacterized protein LOC128266036 [Drosophila gunungcola]
MAFSTQKEFFHVHFMNDINECPEKCLNLKTYPSTTNYRCWSGNEEKKSRFVADLVACNKLPNSDDKPITVEEECADIKRIMIQCHNSEMVKALKIRIKDLTISKHKQNEKNLNEIQKCIDDMVKAQEILEAENSYLKRIIEKQSVRGRLDNLQIDREKSTDIHYLQSKINDMNKEVSLLRQAEEMLIKKCVKMCRGEASASGDAGFFKNDFSFEQDILNAQRILTERDALRKKCQDLEVLGDKVYVLEQKANKAEQLSASLEDSINQQTQYINDMQQEMQYMQNYYENEVDKAKAVEEVLKMVKALKIRIKDLAISNHKQQNEKDLNEIQKCIDNMVKAQEILQAENSYLKRINGKQSIRGWLDSLQIDRENSTDIHYLQSKISDMNIEVSLLRQA